MRRIALVAVGASIVVGTVALTTRDDQTRTPSQRSEALAVVPERVPNPILPSRPDPRAVDTDSLRPRGSFNTSKGDRVGVFEGVTNDRRNRCVLSTGRGSTGVACGRNVFADSPVQFLESGSAGPGGRPIKEWQLSGIALASVARLVVVDSQGQRTDIPLSPDHAFFFELPQEDLARGVSATSLLVYASDGRLIKEVAL
jgi:hypothetical protein